MKVIFAGKTDIGLIRIINEDDFSIDGKNLLFIVADGMGGHAAGEIASHLAIETINDYIATFENDLHNYNDEQVVALLESALRAANREIFERASRERKLKGMGTTLALVFLVNSTAYLAYIGDSRIYLIRNGEILGLTNDHSWVNMQVLLGNMTEEEARIHPMRNIITRALGISEYLEIDMDTKKVQHNDILLLCSDGLNGSLEDEEIRDIVLNNQDDLEMACQELINQAKQNKGDDNITAVLIKIE